MVLNKVVLLWWLLNIKGWMKIAWVIQAVSMVQNDVPKLYDFYPAFQKRYIFLLYFLYLLLIWTFEEC